MILGIRYVIWVYVCLADCGLVGVYSHRNWSRLLANNLSLVRAHFVSSFWIGGTRG